MKFSKAFLLYTLRSVFILSFYGSCFGEKQDYLSAFPQELPLFQSIDHYPWTNPKAPLKGSIALGSLIDFNTFHPDASLMGSGPPGLESVHGTLFHRSAEEDGIAYPYVAQSVEVKRDPKGTPLSVIFYLNPKSVFHDGVAVTADDVVFSFNFLCKNKPHLQAYYAQVKEAKALPAVKEVQAVLFILKDKASFELPLVLSQLTILSKKFYTTHDVMNNPWILPLGCGPYRLKEYRTGQYVTYEKIPSWWGDAIALGKGSFRFQKIRYDIFKNPDTLFEAFKKGDLDILGESNLDRWKRQYHFPAVKEKKTLLKETPIQGILPASAFIFNTRLNLFKDMNVRWALSLMFPFEEVNQVAFHGMYRRFTSFFTNSVMAASGFTTEAEADLLQECQASPEILTTPCEKFTLFEGNLSERRKAAIHLLERSGWRLINGQMVHPSLGPLSFSLLLVQGRNIEKVYHIFRQALFSIGVEMNAVYVDQAAFQAKVQNFDFQMVFGPGSISSNHPGNELLSIYGSKSANTKGSYNWAGIQDLTIDALIQKVLEAKNYGELLNASHCLDRCLLAGCYMILWGYCPVRMMAYWDRFSAPPQFPALTGPDWAFWWQKEEPPKNEHKR